jgi:hypothetical protein
VLKRGSKITIHHFQDVKNIKLIHFDASPTLNSNTVTLTKIDSSQPIVARVLKFRDFSHALNSAYTQYIDQTE